MSQIGMTFFNRMIGMCAKKKNPRIIAKELNSSTLTGIQNIV
jgi:hypothetical protein